MKNIIILIFIPKCIASCEAYWRSNNSMTYGTSIGLSEPSNAISSLVYTAFGLVGICLNNFTNTYYLLMNLLILLGLSSFLHHWYYYDAEWAYIADLISTYLVLCFSLYYITCDNEYFKYKIITKFFNLLNVINYMVIMVCYKLQYSNIIIVKITIYGIIGTQGMICIYFLYIKSCIKYKILLGSLWNFGLGTLGYNLWIFDKECPKWSWYNILNGHMIWHICIAWALFNTINITNICRYTFNEIKFTWKPLFRRIPWFLYIIVLSKEKSNIKDNYTNIESGEINFLINKKKNHRRVNTE